MCLVMVGGETSSNMEMVFFVAMTRFSCNTVCTITIKQHNCRFLVLERNILNMTAGFALFTVVEISHSFG